MPPEETGEVLSFGVISMAADPNVDVELGVPSPTDRPPEAQQQQQKLRGRRRVAFADGVVTEIRIVPPICGSQKSSLFYTRAECRRFRSEVEREMEQDRILMDLLLAEEVKREERSRTVDVSSLTDVSVAGDAVAEAEARGGGGDDDDGCAFDVESLPVKPMPTPCVSEAECEQIVGRKSGVHPMSSLGTQALHLLGVTFVVVCYSYRAFDGEWPLRFEGQ